jgi:exopolysaccharide biosynthesis operon protein EpsL
MTMTLAASAASALEGDPLALTLGRTTSRDDNVFRASANNAPVADTITTSFVGVSLDERYSLQAVHLDLQGNNNRYAKLSALDYDGYRGTAQWLWKVGQSLSGDLAWNRTQTLSGFADIRSLDRNINVADSRSFSAAYAIHPDWSAYLRTTSATYTNSAAANFASDATNHSVELGFQYSGAQGNHAGIHLRTTDGRYPNRQLVPGALNLVDNSYREEALQSTFAWVPSGASRLTAGLGYLKRNHFDVPQRNFTGFIGNVGWDWTATGNTTINLTASRQIGAQEFILANYLVTRTLAFGPRWSPTAKISVEARVERSLRAYGGDPRFIVGNFAEPSDAVTASNLSLQYAPEQFLQLALSIRREQRTSSNAASEYDSNVTTVTAQFKY